MRKPIKAYLITDSNLYPNNPQDFYHFYKKILTKHSISVAAYRDKTQKFDEKLIEIFLALNKEFGVISLINSNINLAKKFSFDGVHCNGSQVGILQEVRNNFNYAFYSAHSIDDLKLVANLGFNGATISPIFYTPNKGAPLGIEFLKNAINSVRNIEIYALGGITTDSKLLELKRINAQHFASIRYFL